MSKLWTIYSSDNEYLASFKVAEHAGMLLGSICDPGATIRYGRGKQIAYTDGVDGNADESFDEVAHHINEWLFDEEQPPVFTCKCCSKEFVATKDAWGDWYTVNGEHFAFS